MNDLFFHDLELIKKDEQQYKAYESMDNTVVIAGPGSGKTRVLALKAVTLAKSHIHRPCGLACISFSRESVRELKKRLKLYGYIPGNKDFIGTVHSFSLLHVIQPFAHLYPQYKVKYPIKILPHDISNQLYNGVLNDLQIENHWDLKLAEINKHRSLSLIGRSAINISASKLINDAAKLYEAKLKQTEYIDFIDIINLSVKIIREQEYVRQSLQSQFPWLLVDEYQDLGKALHEMVLELVFNAGINLYAVGDANQSIYGFNGGYPDFLKELTTSYDDINTIDLKANYRSSQSIIDASLEALQPSPPFPKYIAEKRKEDAADFTFITCEEDMIDQYKIVAEAIIPNLISQGIPLNEMAIIVSSNTQAKHMASSLQKNNISFFIAKWDFENSAVMVWLQECAMWCIDNRKQSFDELFKFWIRLIDNHKDSRRDWESIRLKTLLHSTLNDSKGKNVYEWVNFIVKELELNNTLNESEIYPNEIDNIKNLLTEAKLHNLKNAQLDRFANLGSPDNEVTITTRHSSKGLEFEVVIMLGMEQGNFPNYRKIDNPIELLEEQRLCYVCISRAKKSCILLRSRFINIPKKNGGIWRKEFPASQFWVSLIKKFGTKDNQFTNETYN